MHWGRAIIATLLALLMAGCSALRLTYGQGPLLAYWWMDGYLDFSAEQSPRVKASLEDWFGWHRAEQLPRYAALLGELQTLAGRDVTPREVCGVYDDLQQRLLVDYDQAVPAMAAVLRGLTPAQLDHLARRYADKNDEVRRDYLQSDPDKRRSASLRRVVDRAEMVYGSVNDAQRALLAAALETSPFDPAAWLAERRARQQHVLDSLRALIARNAAPAEFEAALRAYAAHALQSPRAPYRAYRERLEADNCGWIARLHNSMGAAQRQSAVERLQGWADDLQALARPRPAPLKATATAP